MHSHARIPKSKPQQKNFGGRATREQGFRGRSKSTFVQKDSHSRNIRRGHEHSPPLESHPS